jgi:ligand-binding sensor domain-containing protein
MRLHRSCSVFTLSVYKHSHQKAFFTPKFPDGDLAYRRTKSPSGNLGVVRWGGVFRLLALMLLTGLSSISWGQVHTGELQFDRLSVKNGLSHNSILCIWQDPDGFLWLGTKDGLNKYDGYAFTVYKPNPADPANTLGHNWISGICQDRKGRMWVITQGGGLHLFNPQTGKTKAYRIDPGQISMRNAMHSITVDKQGILWIASREGLNRFDPDTKKFTLFTLPNPSKPSVYTVEEDRQGRLWVGTADGLYQLNRKTGVYSRFNLSQNQSDTTAAVSLLFPDPSGALWIGTLAGQLYRLTATGELQTIYTYQPKGREINRFYPFGVLKADAAGNIWGTLPGLDGLIRIQAGTDQLTRMLTNPAHRGSLSSNMIYSLCFDREGIIWIGTDNGLDKHVAQPKKFHTYQPTANTSDIRVPTNSIRALCQDHLGVIWLTNDLGELYSFHRQTGRYQRHFLEPTMAGHLLGDGVTAIYEDRAGHLWVSAGLYLHQLDRKTGLFTRYHCQIRVRGIREDALGKLWLAGWGLACFDPKSQQFTYYRHDPHNPESLGDDALIVALPTRNGSVWAASTRKGISRLDVATGKFTRYQPTYQHPVGSLTDKDIRSLCEDHRGQLWIGTNQGGLNRYNAQTNSFTAFTTEDGLPNNHIVGIVEDAAGNLWLSTNQGVCKFNPTTKTCRNYDESDGLQGNEFFEAYAKGTNGQVIFSGPNGFNIFDPSTIRDNPLIPPVRITGVQIQNKTERLPTETLDLSYEENDLSFDFVALNFIMPEKNQYAYQLTNVDKDWVYCGTRRFVSYTNLDSGEYVFRVKASNNDGVWNEKGAQLRIIIQSPFWQTWWFRGLVLVLVLGLIYMVMQYRIRQVKKQEAQKTAFNKQLAAMEMQALRAQMNPHFIFNSLNSINRFIMKNESEKASDYLAKFSKLIRLILHHSSMPVVTLESELEALQLYLTLESLRFDGQFTFSIQVDKAVEPAYTELPPMIIQPYVENAIWHGLMHKEGGGRITIGWQVEKNVLICTIEDNGIGRKKAAELKSKSATRTKSLGMQITSNRLKLSQLLDGRQPTVLIQDLVDPEGEPAGTSVTVRIPIG